MPDQPPAGLSGNLHLVCASHPARGTFLAEQAFSAPIHLSKAYWDGNTLLVHVVNQTAGFFGGDRVTTHVVVQSGAHVLLSSPSASRFCPSQDREIQLEQTFEVETGGFLDVYPEISIPQRDSRSIQKTVARVQQGGELIYLEILTPGRVASGEAFAFTRYAWATDICVSGRWVHRERASIAPRKSGLAGLTTLFPTSYYAGLTVISPAAEGWTSDFAQAIAALGDNVSVRMAASRLGGGGWSIRLLARDSLALRHGLTRLRKLIYDYLAKKIPEVRRS